MPLHMLTWRWFAKTYGWDPEQVSRLPLEVFTWFPLIEEAEARATEILHKQEQRQGATRR